MLLIILFVATFINISQGNNDLCKTSRIAFLDFNREFDPTRYDDLHNDVVIHSNFRKRVTTPKPAQVDVNSSSSLTTSSTTISKVVHIVPVKSILNSSFDAYTRFVYNSDSELINQTQQFTLYATLQPYNYQIWHDKNDTAKMIKVLSTFLNITDYLDDSMKSVVENRSLDAEQQKYHAIKFNLKIPYQVTVELDEILINLIKLMKATKENFDLNCVQKIAVDTIELVNSDAQDELYTFTHQQNTQSLIDKKLISHVTQHYIFRPSGHHYRYSIRISDRENVTISTSGLITSTGEMNCYEQLYVLKLSHDIKFREQVMSKLLKNKKTQIVNETTILLCNDEHADLNRQFNAFILESIQNEHFLQTIYAWDEFFTLIFSLVSCLLMPLLFALYLKFKTESFKALFKENHLIYILLLTLFLAHLITIVNILWNRFQSNVHACLVFALMRQYVWLTTIFQMNVYAIDLYFKIVKPFSVYSRKPPYLFYISYFLIMPLLFTVIPLILHFNYKQSTIYSLFHCSLTGMPLFLCFFLPICIVCLISLILMFIYYRRLKNTQRVKSQNCSKSDANKNSQLLNTFIKLCFLIGVSWLIYIIVAILNMFIVNKYFKFVLILPTVQIYLQGAFVSLVHFVPVIYEKLVTERRKESRKKRKNTSDTSGASKRLLSTITTTTVTSAKK